MSKALPNIQEKPFLPSLFHLFLPAFKENLLPGQINEIALSALMEYTGSQHAAIYTLHQHSFELIPTCSKGLLSSLEKYFVLAADNRIIARCIETELAQINTIDNQTLLIVPIIPAHGLHGIFILMIDDNFLPEQQIIESTTLFALQYYAAYHNSCLRSELIDIQDLMHQQITARTFALEQSKRELRAMLDHMQAGIFLVDMNSELIAEANDTALDMIGRARYEVIGTPSSLYLSAIERDNAFSQAGSHSARNYESTLHGNNGEMPILRTSATLIMNGAYYRVETFLDISNRIIIEDELRKANEILEIKVAERTSELIHSIHRLEQEVLERKTIENALRKSEYLFSHIFSNASIPICLTNAHGELLNYNQAFSDLTGLGIYNDSLKLGFADIIPSDIYHNFDASYNSFYNGDLQTFTNEVIVNNKKGLQSICIMSSAKFPDEKGITIIISVFVDITQRIKAEQDMKNALAKEKELNELKTRFISVVSHEFRTPLTTILSYTQLLLKYQEKWTPEQQTKYLHSIETGVHKLSFLMSDILSVARLQHGALIFKPQKTNIKSLLQGIIEEFIMGDDNRHIFDINLRMEEEEYIADAGLLRQIFSNLISNAIKYSANDTTINIYAEDKDDSSFLFRISDEGIGIESNHLPYLYEYFRRGDNVGTISGTGLGMSIVKQSVDLHNGTIEVASQPGLGTEFTIQLHLQKA
jgi:PAS domain S-box-containing protein